MRKKLIFSEEEYHQRVRKTKERMDKSGMEMLLVGGLANMLADGLVRRDIGLPDDVAVVA